MCLCDVASHDGRDIAPSPRQVLKKQVERAREMGFEPMIGSELEFYLLQGDLRGGAREGLREPDAVGAVHHRLPRPRDHLRRAVHPPGPQRHARGRDPGRVLEGRGLAGPARDQLPLRRGGRGRRPAHDLQERHQGARPPERLLGHLHGEAARGLDRQLLPRPLEPLGGRQERVRGRVALVQELPRRAHRRAAGAGRLPRADDQLVQALRRRVRGRRRRSPGATTTAPAASASSGTGSRCARRRASPAPTRTRTSASRRSWPAA